MAKEFIVAIDGTAGSGKSTTARLAARQLGFLHLDTGAMYRAVTLKAIRQKLDLNDTARLGEVVAQTVIDLKPEQGANRIIMDGEDVTRAIRTPEVDRMVSPVSVAATVREHLVAQQRRIAHGREVVCEGRDIGSVVFPRADLKFYMDCDLNARARRRHVELQDKGVAQTGKSIADNLSQRDYIDSTRTHSPLTRVSDAILLDTTNLTIDEEVAIVVLLTRIRMKVKANGE
jgi:cytidylate kinase